MAMAAAGPASKSFSGCLSADSLQNNNNGNPLPLNNYTTVFIPNQNIPAFERPVYNLELYRSIEQTTGNSQLSECIQKIGGLWRITVKNSHARALLLTRGLNIRGHTVTVLGQNPFLYEGEETVRLSVINFVKQQPRIE